MQREETEIPQVFRQTELLINDFSRVNLHKNERFQLGKSFTEQGENSFQISVAAEPVEECQDRTDPEQTPSIDFTQQSENEL